MSTANEVLRWKERRTLLPVWASMGALFLFGLLMLALGNTTGPKDMHVENYLTLFWLASSVIGLATGIMLFAPEREHGTDLLLGRMPIESKAVARVKLVEALLVFVLFVAVSLALVVAAFWIRRGEFLLGNISWQRFTVLAFIPIQTFLWSCLCSLWFRSSLKAVITAAVLSMIGWISTAVGTVFLVQEIYGMSGNQDQFVGYALGANGLLVLVLWGAIWRSGATWLRGSYSAGKVRVADRVGKVSARRQATAYPFKSLMWHGLRMNWIVLLAISAATIFFSFVATSIWGYHIRYRGSFDIYAIYNVQMALSVISGAASGFVLFRGDQSRSKFLFFQQYADYPRRLWLSRVALLGLTVPFVIVSLVWISETLFTAESVENVSLPGMYGPIFRQPVILNGVVVLMLAASIAQLISIICRSGILAFFLTAAAMLVVTAWCGTILWTGTPLFIFALPVILVCFLVSWWYAPRWISQRKPIRSIAIPVCIATTVFFMSSFGYVFSRVAISVPKLPPEFAEAFESHDQFLNADKQRYKSVFQIKEAAASLNFESIRREQASLPEDARIYSGWPDELLEKSVAANKDPLAMIEEAVADDLVYHWLAPKSLTERHSQYNLIAEPLAIQSEHFWRKQEVNLLLDSLTSEVRAAWRSSPTPGQLTARKILRFCNWSEMEGQTEELLRSGIAKLERLRFEIFNAQSQRIQYEVYFDIARKFAKSEPDSNFLRGVLSEGPEHWEKIHDHRMRLNEFSVFTKAIHLKLQNREIQWADYLIRDSRRAGVDYSVETARYFGLLMIERAIRYASLRIALQSWQLKHGSYPETLDQLVSTGGSESLLSEMPVDPATGMTFAYFPQGLGEPAYPPALSTFNRAYPNGYQSVHDSSDAIPENRPFILPFSGNFKTKNLLSGVPTGKKVDFHRAYVFESPPHYGPELDHLFLVRSEEFDYLLAEFESSQTAD